MNVLQCMHFLHELVHEVRVVIVKYVWMCNHVHHVVTNTLQRSSVRDEFLSGIFYGVTDALVWFVLTRVQSCLDLGQCFLADAAGSHCID